MVCDFDVAASPGTRFSPERSHARLFRWATLGIAVAAGGASADPLIRYSVTNVAFPGRFSQTTSLNSSGQVAGVYTFGAGQSRAYSWDPTDGFREYPELEGAGFPLQRTCSINDSGVVVVTTSGFFGTEFITRAVVVEQGRLTLVPPAYGEYTDAAAINNFGHVTGRTDAPLSALHAYLYTPAGTMDLGQIEPPFGSNFIATGINDSDQIVGIGDNAAGTTSGFLWNGAMQNLGTFQPAAINNSGVICGRAPVAEGSRAVVRTADGSVEELGTLGGRNSAAMGINAAADVVGSSQLPDGSSAGFLWRSGTIVNLNSMLSRRAVADGWQISSANAINRAGLVLAFSGYDPVLLTPIDDCCADFNGDGGVDGDDIDAFFVAWDEGDLLADVAEDGGVDGTDIEVFFEAWTQGGC